MVTSKELSVEQRVRKNEESATAHVFYMRDPSRVCKIRFAPRSANERTRAEQSHLDELAAYGVAAANPELCDHVARCFGPVQVSRVVSKTGEDISDGYLLGTAFALEHLAGRDRKAYGLDMAKYPHVRKLIDAFLRGGLDAGDASVFGYAATETAKFIDFTTKWGMRRDGTP